MITATTTKGPVTADNLDGVGFAAEITVRWDEGGPGAPGLFGHFVALGGVGLVS